MVFQANRYYGAPQQAHNEHAALTNEKRDQEVARHGDIKPDASGLTKFWRGVKNAPSGPLNMIRNLVSTAAVVAPIPSLGKISGVMNFLKSTPMQVIRKNSDFLKSTPMQAIRSTVKGKTPTSKPVNFKGPNPAHKTGAGGNSYSQQYDDAVNLLQSNPTKASKLGLNPLSTSIKQEGKSFVPIHPRASTGVVGKPGIPAYSKKDPLWPKSVDEKLYPSNWPAWHK